MICPVRTDVRLALALVRYYSDFAKHIILNKDNQTKTISKLKALPIIRMHTQEPLRRAAVLIPLCIVDNQVSLLYTLRASQLRLHKGQVSFPGGMQDAKDKSLEVTALRETKEELGIPSSRINVWGTGNVIVPKSDISVMPVVGTISGNLNLSEFILNRAEVEEAFTVPLEELCKAENLGYTQFKSGYSTPVFLGGSKRIWGLTAIITHAFLKCLLPNQLYAHKVSHLPAIKTDNKLYKMKK